MKEFKICCRDSITGFEMILSDCSYNMAMDWLVRKNIDILSCKNSTIYNNMTVIKTGIWSHILGDFKPSRTFYYDETRGYLLGD